MTIRDKLLQLTYDELISIRDFVEESLRKPEPASEHLQEAVRTSTQSNQQ